MLSRFLGFFNEISSFDVKGMIKKFHEDETGQGMTEYIIIIVLVAILVLFVVKAFGGKIKALFTKSTETLGSETEGAFSGS